VVLAHDQRCTRDPAPLAYSHVLRLRPVIDLDLRVKRRDPEASIRVALRDVRCPRCNGNGRPRILALSKLPL